jgi:hypothetical protein
VEVRFARAYGSSECLSSSRPRSVPLEQASVRLIATPTAVGVSSAVIGSDGLVVAVILNNLGDGEAWLSDVSVEGGTSWRLLNPWEPTVLAAGNHVSVNVHVDPQAEFDGSTLVVVAEGRSVEPAGCSAGVEVPSDGLEVPLYSVSINACDVDDDGFIAGVCGGDDCDDGNAAVNPQVVEPCNAVDDDCDGAIDEGFVPQPWYADRDGDGDDAARQGSGPVFESNDDDCVDADASTQSCTCGIEAPPTLCPCSSSTRVACSTRLAARSRAPAR